MSWTDDPAYDAEQYYNRLEREIAKRPVCDVCGEHIQEEYCYEVDGKLICEDCLRVFHRWREEGDGLRCGLCGELIKDADYHELEDMPVCEDCLRVFHRNTDWFID